MCGFFFFSGKYFECNGPLNVSVDVCVVFNDPIVYEMTKVTMNF